MAVQGAAASRVSPAILAVDLIGRQERPEARRAAPLTVSIVLMPSVVICTLFARRDAKSSIAALAA
jgi:hypothetical protein